MTLEDKEPLVRVKQSYALCMLEISLDSWTATLSWAKTGRGGREREKMGNPNLSDKKSQKE